MKTDDLYNALVGNLWKLAAHCSLAEDDLRQELYLICMEVAEGRSAYSPLIGDVHKYILGRLWGHIHKWPVSYGIDDLMIIDGNEEDDNHKVPVEFHVPSVEVVLEQQNLLYEQDVIDVEKIRRLRKRLKGQSILLALIEIGHWTTREAAAFCDVNHLKIWREFKKTKRSVEYR